jgi:hypothetical protein
MEGVMRQAEMMEAAQSGIIILIREKKFKPSLELLFLSGRRNSARSGVIISFKGRKSFVSLELLFHP